MLDADAISLFLFLVFGINGGILQKTLDEYVKGAEIVQRGRDAGGFGLENSAGCFVNAWEVS